MLTVVTSLWAPNEKSFAFSRCYDERWVERLFRGFARNLTRPFRFVCFSDRPRIFAHAEIAQMYFNVPIPTYGDGFELYSVEGPLIVVGLDTVITGNIDHLADHCCSGGPLALIRDPFNPERSANGVVLAPADHGHVLDGRLPGEDDMAIVAKHPHVLMDDLWPGQVISFKGAGRPEDLGPDVRIVYFHGRPKMHELGHLPWIAGHWR